WCRRYGVTMKAHSVPAGENALDAEGVKIASVATWENLRAVLREHFGETAFRRWFESVTATVTEDEAGMMIAIYMPPRFMRDWVEAHYGDGVRTLWKQMVKLARAVFLVASPLPQKSETLAKTAGDAAEALRSLTLPRGPLPAAAKGGDFLGHLPA